MVNKFAYMLQKVIPNWYTKNGGLWNVFVPYIWNHKWMQSKVMYRTKTGSKKVDIKSVFEKDSPLVETQAIKAIKRCKTEDAKMLAIWKWTKNNIKYKSDHFTQGMPEYWQAPMETLLSRQGDCEDGAILMAQMAKEIGIPSYRVKLCAGWVGDVPVGHAYLIYLLKGTDKWIILDWCYWPNKVPYRWTHKIPHKACDQYKEIWWTTNWEKSWAQKDVIMRDGLKD